MSNLDWLLSLPLGLAAAVPIWFVLSACFVSRRSPLQAPVRAAAFACILAAGAIGLSLFAGAPRSPTGDLAGLDAWIRLDLPTSSTLALVCALALVVARYSRTYLAGEAGLLRYSRALQLALASITTIVISNHLAVLVFAWFATSLCLHQLLTFYRERPQALVAAHKKFLISRAADVCLVAALFLIDRELGTLHIDRLNAFALAKGALPLALHAAAALLALGVLLKSAQLPFHGWMTQVMEAPTPVSALLHAGIVNIGGFVMIRLAPLMAQAPLAQGVLVAAGLTTAIVASLVMTTRVSIKVSLAWSTIAQMGFMLAQCGLGAWKLALLHLLAHSLYKAHAFLSTGGAVEAWRGAAIAPAPKASVPQLAAGVAAGLALVAAIAYMAGGASDGGSASVIPLSLVLALSLAPMLAYGLASGASTFARSALLGAAAAAAYMAWHSGFEHVASLSVEGAESETAWAIVACGLALLFALQAALQARPNGRLAAWLQPRLFAAFYLDEWFTRMTFRIWPPNMKRIPVALRSAQSFKAAAESAPQGAR